MDSALGEAGLNRKVTLPVLHFLLLSVLASTDRSALQVVEPPLAVPGYEMAMLWAERSLRDPAHKWFREHLAASV